jgi:enoyl-CoA hydratase/carnithine racemase
VAVVQGACLGGGLVLAAACDLRLAGRSARFGVPIARTLGNCLSMNSMSLLVDRLGSARALDLLLRARLLSGEEAHAAGFVSELVDDDLLDSAAASLISSLLGHAPRTLWATKQAVTRLRRTALPDADDVVARTYGSSDFHRAVTDFAQKRRPTWQGR